jgi:hypothetical protein
MCCILANGLRSFAALPEREKNDPENAVCISFSPPCYAE